MHKSLLMLSFFSTTIATVFHELSQVGLFVKFSHFLLIALLTKSGIFEGFAIAVQTSLMIVVLAKSTL